jgi:hypothetical protein
MTDSSMTIPSDSENYETHHELSSSPPDSSEEAPVILYSPPTFWGLMRGAAINLLLPFVNGLMLGFGELFAHELAFRWGWSGTKVRIAVHPLRLLAANDDSIQIFPSHRGTSARTAGPGVEVHSDPVERRRRAGEEMTAYTSLE